MDGWQKNMMRKFSIWVQGGRMKAFISRRLLDDAGGITCMRKATAIANTIEVYGTYATRRTNKVCI